MPNSTSTEIDDIIVDAVQECTTNQEEQGGVILYKEETKEYRFVKITNANAGTPIANALWTADRNEYAKVILPLFKEGWRSFGSFHTHPKWRALPSNIDLTELFPGFPVNFIFSGIENNVNRFEQGESFWELTDTLELENEHIA